MGLKHKFSFILLLIFCCTQKTEGQKIFITDSIPFSIETSELSTILQELAEQTGLRFAFRNSLLEGKRSNSFNHTGTIEELLHKLLDPHKLCFTYQNAQVIIHTACQPKHYSVSGTIVQSIGQTIVPYVSISLLNGKMGVIADHTGYFEINLESRDKLDTLIFSCMGYYRDTLIVSANNSENVLVMLKERIYALPPATIKPKVFEFEKLGNSKDHASGSLYLDTHGQQTALFINNDKSRSGRIEAVEYFLSDNGNIDAPFRVRIYTVDSMGMPDKDLVKDAIVVKPNESKGWYRIDLSNEEIEFPKSGAFIAIEGVFPDDYDYYYGSAGFIDLKNNSNKQESALTYGQRLGYNRKCRKNTWHYSMSKVWFQIEKQAYGIMISATIKYEKNTDYKNQGNE